MAGNLLMSISQNEVERARFRSRRKFETDYQSDLATSRDLGRQEGWQEGLRDGRQEGRVEMARLMIAGGEPEDKIMRYTGLSFQEIKKLKN